MKMPRSPFSTSLSGSAKETELRLRSIFQWKKKRPPVILLLAAILLVAGCGSLPDAAEETARPQVSMDVQYYDIYGNYIEIPRLTMPDGQEPLSAVETINAQLSALKAQYAELFADPSKVVGNNHCLLYPTVTDRYLNLVIFQDDSSYGNDGMIRSWVYDQEENRVITTQDALDLAEKTEEELCGGLEQLIAHDPEAPRSMYEPAQILGFRIQASGSPVFYLAAYVDAAVMPDGSQYDEWYRLYIWESGAYTRYDCMSFQTDQLPLVPAEETVPMDQPLWCQWYFEGGEPEGGFITPGNTPAEEPPENSEDGDPPSASPNAPEESENSFSFAQLQNYEFYFSSGAGAWATTMMIHADGSFDGVYYDSDMDIQYYCAFHGQLMPPVKVNEYTYSTQISAISYENEVGTEESRDGIRYIYSEAYGLQDAEDILIYLPGAPLAELPQGYRDWVGYHDISDKEETGLPFMGLYNENAQCGFSGYDIVSSLQAAIASAEEQAAVIESREALTQAELNEQAQELYELWDSLLNRQWSLLKKILDADSMRALTAEELEWIERKEAAVKEAGAEVEGGSLYPCVTYSKAAEITKDRVYELMELFD